MIACRDSNGLEYLRRATEIHWRGLSFDLRGFQCIVLLDWHTLQPNAEWPWDRLCDSLGGKGVHSIHDEMVKLRLRPLHDALRNALSQANVRAFAELAAEIAKQTVAKGNAASTSSSVKTELDLRLRTIADKSQLFLDRLLEQIPEENRTSRTDNQTDAESTTSPGVVKAPATESTVELRAEAAPMPTYSESLRAMLASGANLQALAQSYTTHWPAQSRPMLPGNSPATRQERTWARDPRLVCTAQHSRILCNQRRSR